MEITGTSSSRSTDSLRPSLRNNFVFQDPALRRATTLARVLKCCGSILRNSSGSASTFEMSRAAENIDVFISHNWTTPQCLKFFTLAMHFNLLPAGLLTLAVMLLVIILTGLRVLPVFENPFGSFNMVCTSLGFGIFLVMLAFVRDIGLSMGWVGPNVFLDKVCIHQTDPALKRRGIQCLGAFLCDSSVLVVVYTEEYLEKLWTMFEIASFISLRSPRDLIILPTMLTKTTLVVALLGYCVMVPYQWFITLGGLNRSSATVAYTIAYSFGVLALTGIMRQWARERAQIAAQASNFRPTHARCFTEADRPVVNGIIVDLMRELDYVPLEATPEVALLAFERIVRSVVPAALDSSIGHVFLPYSHVIVMSQVSFWLTCDRLAGVWSEGLGPQHMCAEFIYRTTTYFALLPCLVYLVGFLATRWLNVRGCIQAALLMSVPIFVMPIYYLVDSVAFVLLRDRARTSMSALGIFVGIECIAIAFVFFIYRPLSQRAQQVLVDEERCPRSKDEVPLPALVGADLIVRTAGIDEIQSDDEKKTIDFEI